jgi:hypothetical protein
MRPLCRAFSVAGIVTALSAVSVRGQQADTAPPEIDNKWVFMVPSHVVRASDGLRIRVPLSLSNFDFGGAVVYLSRIHEVVAWGKGGIKCGTGIGGIEVEGLTAGTDREDAFPLRPGETREIVISMPCEKPALGEAFMLSLELVIYVGTSERAVRIGGGWPYVPAK